MVDVKPSDLTPDSSITGTEIFVGTDADGTSPISGTPNDFSAWTIDQIEAITVESVLDSGDSIQILKNGSALANVTYATLEDAVAETMYGHSDIGALASADVFLVQDNATTKGITTALAIATYCLSRNEPLILDISDKTAKATPVNADLFLNCDGGTPKKTTWAQIKTTMFAALPAHVTALDAVSTVADADVIYTLQSGSAKKLSISTLISHISFVNYDELWIDAFATTTSETTGMDTESKEYGTYDNTHFVLLGDGSSQDESVEFDYVMPPAWDRSTIKFKIYWSPGHSDANVGEWVKFELSALASSNDDGLDTELGTVAIVTDEAIADDDLHITAASGALTIAGTPALGDMIHFKLSRDYDYAGTGSAMDVDARIFGISIQYKKTEEVVAW